MTACPGLTGRACLRFPAARPRTDCAATFRSCEAVSNVSDQSGASACRSASRHHATSPRGPLAGVNGHAKVVRRRFFLIVDLLRAQQRRRVSRRRGRMCQFGSFGLASRREPAEVPRRSAAARAAQVSMEASWGTSFNRGMRRSTLPASVAAPGWRPWNQSCHRSSCPHSSERSTRFRARVACRRGAGSGTNATLSAIICSANSRSNSCLAIAHWPGVGRHTSRRACAHPD